MGPGGNFRGTSVISFGLRGGPDYFVVICGSVNVLLVEPEIFSEAMSAYRCARRYSDLAKEYFGGA